MRPGSVLVDIAIDQGGCFETSRPTTHSDADLCRGRRGALLRHQHAGRGGAHLDLRADQRDPAVRAGAGRARAGGRRCWTIRIWPRAEHPCRAGDAQSPWRGRWNCRTWMCRRSWRREDRGLPRDRGADGRVASSTSWSFPPRHGRRSPPSRARSPITHAFAWFGTARRGWRATEHAREGFADHDVQRPVPGRAFPWQTVKQVPFGWRRCADRCQLILQRHRRLTCRQFSNGVQVPPICVHLRASAVDIFAAAGMWPGNWGTAQPTLCPKRRQEIQPQMHANARR